jgi:23S rRNA (guanosine2251-2'-O)-methyltransferase
MREGHRRGPRRGFADRAGRGNAAERRNDEEPLIFGIHAVEAALANPQRVIRKLFLTDNAERRLHGALTARQLAHEGVLPRDLDRRLGADTVHQGALIETAPLPEPTLAELAENAAGRPLIVLDQVTDPHNVGAILRSAAVFGAAGLIMTRRHSPPLDGALAKAASGALEHVPVALVQNLSRAILELRDLACTVIGLDGDGTGQLERMAWPERPALVFGAEGKGLRRLTRDSCDYVCRITSAGTFDSLNVSNAAAITLHWASVQRMTAAQD